MAHNGEGDLSYSSSHPSGGSGGNGGLHGDGRAVAAPALVREATPTARRRPPSGRSPAGSAGRSHATGSRAPSRDSLSNLREREARDQRRRRRRQDPSVRARRRARRERAAAEDRETSPSTVGTARSRSPGRSGDEVAAPPGPAPMILEGATVGTSEGAEGGTASDAIMAPPGASPHAFTPADVEAFLATASDRPGSMSQWQRCFSRRHPRNRLVPLPPP